ncbi:hypothetical protein GmHk_18G053400 [Glycine max]|nr:hypothetical protein GmHk_18G053400 [Glycine max]
MGLLYGLGLSSSPATTTSFCDMVPQRFLSIDIKSFHQVSQLQTNGMVGDVRLQCSPRTSAQPTRMGIRDVEHGWDIRI